MQKASQGNVLRKHRSPWCHRSCVTSQQQAAPDPGADSVEPDAELAHRNNVLGIALFGLSLLLFAGTFLIAFIYLAVD